MSTSAARAWQLLTIAVSGAALLTQTYLVIIGSVDVNAGASTALLPLPLRLVNLFSYFTIQSNLLVVIAAIRLLIDPTLADRTRGSIWWRVVRADALLGIIITGLVYLTVLRPLTDPTGIFWWVNAGLHYATPILAPLGWLIFGPRPRLDLRVLALALGWPIAWVAYALIRGAVTGWYPYPFLDADVLGWPIALRNVGIVVLLGVIILAVLRILDARLPATNSRGEP